MSSVGETLRRERIKRNLDLDQISHELKISGRMLDAIESDQYERLPGGVFAKAFVRQYAKLLGLDGEELAGQVQRAMEPPPLTQSEAKISRPSVSPIDVPRVEEWSAVGDKGFRLSGSLPAAALVVVAMLICSAVYAWMQRPRTPAQKPAPVAAKIESAPQPQTAQASSPSPVPAETQPAAPQPATPQGTVPAAPQVSPAVQNTAPPNTQPVSTTPATAPGPVHVEIVADEAAWVLARVDGKYAFSDTLPPTTKRTLDGTKDVVLRLGNAGGVTITLNGKPIGPAGPKGQIRTLQFTSGGFQIVSAKPPDAPVPLDR
jgi:cytoskeleton protein RodZ